jgi:hypothetical protein
MVAGDDMRYHLELYGIHYNDWEITFGTFNSVHKVLIEDYISDATSCTETSAASDTNKFIFPHHIKKKYFIEGTITGQITVASSNATSHVTSYCVTVSKVNDNTNAETPLFTTGWRDLENGDGIDLPWDSTYEVGEERVIYFEIDAWEKVSLGEFDRIFITIEFKCDNNAVLWHSNNPTYNDVYVDIPLRLS